MTHLPTILSRLTSSIAFCLMGVLVGAMIWLSITSWQQSFLVSRAQTEVSEWPTVEGTLLEAHLVQTPRTEFRVQYEYDVDGVGYENDDFSLERIVMSCSWDKEQIHQLWQQQNSRGSVTVHFDPQDPSRSVLYAGTDVIATSIAVDVFTSLLTIGVSGGYIYASYGLLRTRFRKPAKDEDPVVEDFP